MDTHSQKAICVHEKEDRCTRSKVEGQLLEALVPTAHSEKPGYSWQVAYSHSGLLPLFHSETLHIKWQRSVVFGFPQWVTETGCQALETPPSL